MTRKSVVCKTLRRPPPGPPTPTTRAHAPTTRPTGQHTSINLHSYTSSGREALRACGPGARQRAHSYSATSHLHCHLPRRTTGSPRARPSKVHTANKQSSSSLPTPPHAPPRTPDPTQNPLPEAPGSQPRGATRPSRRKRAGHHRKNLVAGGAASALRREACPQKSSRRAGGSPTSARARW